jgi:hypothetical protein
MRLLFDPQLQSSAKEFPIGIAAQVRERIYVGLRTGGGMWVNHCCNHDALLSFVEGWAVTKGQ